jgi:hypothetical protein
VIGPDNNLNLTVGDLRGDKSPKYSTAAQNIQGGEKPDGRAGILRITQDDLSR